MATKPEEPETEQLKEANRQLRKALEDCHELLARTEEKLRTSQQDNEPREQ